MIVYEYLTDETGYIVDVRKAYQKRPDESLLCNDPPPPEMEEMRTPSSLHDLYFNHKWWLEKYSTEEGELRYRPVLKPMRPTDEQIALHKKKRYVEEIRKVYTQDDEIAITKKITEKLLNGETPLPEDVRAFKDMQDFVRERKDRVRQEIEEDLKTFYNNFF